jgi:hypothetical protein
MKTAASLVVRYKERIKKNDWYDEECQIKVEERNTARAETLS